MSHKSAPSPEFTKFYAAVYLSTHEHFTTNINNKASYRTQARSSPPTKPGDLKSSMVSSLPNGSFGILLPIGLLAVFLSCVVCVYHWQGTRERRLDMEDDRKRKRTLSKYDSGCALKSVKPVNKNKARSYPWKTRIQDLGVPDINSNDGFEIPIFSGMRQASSCYHGDSSRFSAVMGQASSHHMRPILKMNPILDNAGYTTRDLSALSCDVSREISLSLSADTTTESCLVPPPCCTEKENPGFKNGTGCDDINEHVTHVTLPGDGQIVFVEPLNGPLLEYWV